MRYPAGLTYAFFKLGPAIEELVGTGDIKERLRATLARQKQGAQLINCGGLEKYAI